MRPSEIRELMKLRGWSATKLAAALDVTESTVHKWLSGVNGVKGPAAILLREWLKQARREKETVPA